MIPVFGLLSAALTAVGVKSLYWYHSLSVSDRAKADQIVLQYAQQLYSCGLDELTSGQLRRVHDLVKKHF